MTILDVQEGESAGFAHLALRGELDLSTVPKVEEALKRIEEGQPPVIVLDLGGLTFLDSTGLRMVVTADQRARAEARRLAVVRGPESVQRVFTITRLDEHLDMVDDVSAVESAGSPEG
ncbi:MAG TPA: STAS domain-containing protein [Thermoleophilaceae bacterium]|nr:STAS domain-containing protein [Thermoleophilaceae bacterium]